MDDILDILQLGCAVKLDRFQAVRLGSYIKKLQAENEALTKLISEKAMVHVSMNVAEIRAEAHNAALVALSEQLKHQTERAEMAEIFIENLAPELGAGATVAEIVDRVAQWLDADHGERLAELRAEAIENAVEATKQELTPFGQKWLCRVADLKAHADKVRQGEQSGTWLRDENVNGGKRQGGEK